MSHVGAALSRFEALANGAIDPDSYGLSWYASIEDAAVRAVRSAQVIATIRAIRSHLEALTLGAADVRRLIGPNGRTVTGSSPEELVRINTGISNTLQSAGSLLDVLGALATLSTGIAVDPSAADSRHLLNENLGIEPAAAAQRALLQAMRDAIGAPDGTDPAGWISWTIELRNALVHRGSMMAMWCPARTRTTGPPIAVVSKEPPHHLTRQFPHLRRRPDLTDAETILLGLRMEDLVVREPAQQTLDGLAGRCAEVVVSIMDLITATLPQLSAFSWPQRAWRLKAERRPRAQRADAFEGFAVDASFTIGSTLTLNSGDAQRLLLVERLRSARHAEASRPAAPQEVD